MKNQPLRRFTIAAREESMLRKPPAHYLCDGSQISCLLTMFSQSSISHSFLIVGVIVKLRDGSCAALVAHQLIISAAALVLDNFQVDLF